MCVVQKVDEVIDSGQRKAGTALSQLASLRRISLLGGDFRIYSSSLHRLGHVFFINQYQFEEIGNICPPLIKDGCIHGYVMEYISRNNIEKGVTLCTTTSNIRVKLACIHALGHSYLEFNDQSAKEANLSFCRNYVGSEYAACLSGLFHENSKFGRGMGHAHYYDRTHEYNNILCDDFTGQDYIICYGAVGSFRQYYPESESLKKTIEICDEAKIQPAKDMCKYYARQRINIARGYSAVNYK